MKQLSRYEHGDRFDVLDLIAKCAFKSPGSASFHLGVDCETLDLPYGASFKCNVFKVIGSLDVHYTCDDHIKVRIRVRLPARYHSDELMQKVVEQVLWQLAIPADETYELDLSSFDVAVRLEQATDRYGMTDRTSC